MQIFKQMGVEATEEAISEVGNNVADAVIMGDRSEYERFVQSLIAKGMNPKAARQEAFMQFYVKNTLISSASGGISGGVSGSIASLARTATNGRNKNSSRDRQLRSAYEDMHSSVTKDAYTRALEQARSGDADAKSHGELNSYEDSGMLFANDDVWDGAGNGRVLWSGGRSAMDEAANFAMKYGLKTLEQTTTGKLLTSCQNIAGKIWGPDKAYKLIRPLWDKASASFVKGSDGVIHAFLNSQGISDASVFMRIEYEIVKELGIEIKFYLVK